MTGPGTSTRGEEFFRQLRDESSDAGTPDENAPARSHDVVDPHARHPIDGSPATREPGAAHTRARPKRRAGQLNTRVCVLALGSVAGIVILLALQDGTKEPADQKAGRAIDGAPPPHAAVLSVRWARQGGVRLRRPWSRRGRAMITGRLLTRTERAISGALLNVQAEDAARPQDGSHRVARLRTDREGRFRAWVALGRGSAHKLLTLSYPVDGGGARARAALHVYAPVTITAGRRDVPRSRAVRLTARTVPRARLTLAAQAADADRWRTLARMRADGRGRWTGAVRLPRDARVGRWRLRALTAASPRSGYEGATSRPLTVQVR